jgi:hypothetical protein
MTALLISWVCEVPEEPALEAGWSSVALLMEGGLVELGVFAAERSLLGEKRRECVPSVRVRKAGKRAFCNVPRPMRGRGWLVWDGGFPASSQRGDGGGASLPG